MIESPQGPFRLTAEDSFPAPKWYAQQTAWVQNPKDPENVAYNHPIGLRMRGPLDRSALERSIHEIVKRHQPLRSVFRIVDDRLIQTVLPAQPVSLPVVDLNNVCEATREAEALRLAIDDANRPFDLGQDLLLRAKLWCLGPQDHLLLLTTHHIVSDNLSMAILLRELSLVYGAFSARQPSPLPDISFQYGDFVRREQKRVEHKQLEYIAFWKQQLANTHGFHYLPSDHTRPTSPAYRGAHEHLIFEASLASSLRILSQREKVSPFMVLLAALQCLLSRYSGQREIGVASCVANRQSAQVENLVGHFSNHLIFRASLADNPSFCDVLRQVRRTALTAYSYQEFPFGDLLEQLQIASGSCRDDLFQVLMVLTETPKDKWTFAGLDVSMLQLEVGTTAYDLIVWLKLEERLEVNLQYNSDLFEVDTIRQILADYGAVLSVISKNPEAPVDELGIGKLQAESDNHQQPENPLPAYVGPNDIIESQLIQLWESVFDKRPISIEDDFFELGGTSLLAARLFGQIEETFELSIPLAALLQAPTIKKLTNVIRAPDLLRSSRSLVAIQPNGDRPPLFCIHGESGNLLMYRTLARCLGPDQPVYGLQPQGLDGKEAPLTTIEDMAARYIKEIRVIQPAGPYFLAGYCMGGTIAFEMAQQLRLQGQGVDLLALLDTYNWRMIKRTFLRDLQFSVQKWWFTSRHWLSHFFSMSPRKRVSLLKARFYELRGESELSECNRRAACSYVPKVYPGRLLHVRPARQFARYNTPEVGWDKLVAGELEIFFVPSCYPAQVVEEPFVRDLASKLRSCITGATARGNRIPEADRERRHEPVSFTSRSIPAPPETLCGLRTAVENLKACQ